MREGEEMAIINSNFRLTGLASGLDTDQMVKDLMNVARIPLTKLEQQRKLAEWRQESYREFTNSLRGFKEQFFDVTKQTSYLLSSNAFKAFSVKSSSDAHVTVKGTSLAQASSHTVKVLKLATADKAVSNTPVSKPVTGDGITNFNLAGKSIRINLDGVTREITLSDYSSSDSPIADLVADLQSKIDTAFGSTTMTVASGTQNDALTSLGIISGTSNRISTGSQLSALTDKLQGGLTFSGGKVSFSINEESFSFSQDDTLQKVMDTINNSTKANVTLRYDETSDKFTITAKQTGAGDNIRIDETGGTFFAAIGINASNPVSEQGVDAMAEIDGIAITRSTNTFTVNGLEYTLRQQHTTEQIGETISVEQDVDKVFNSIKLFVDEYNKLIDSFSTKLSEKYDRDYQPLSDDEKEAMSEDDVKKWEDKAKTGLLRNDPILQKLQSDMRLAMMNAVEGVGISLSSIGISSKSYEDKGKLTIDEAKLKQAIREKPDEVKSLFQQQSEDVPSYTRNLTAEQRSTRYQQQGLLYRISDLVEDHISILRNKDGRKGILLEKAGMKGDASEFNSSLAQDITDYNERISEVLTKLITKEENYYKQFSQLETYMNKMNSQMDWLTSQLSGLS
jgi:flagellar hook-associated protein 2